MNRVLAVFTAVARIVSLHLRDDEEVLTYQAHKNLMQTLAFAW